MLQEKINNDLKDAMKARDALKTSCLRMIIADIKNVSIAKQAERKLKPPLKDEDIIEVLQRQVKQHKDSIEGFKKGGRQDLVDKETKESGIIRGYLPEQLTPDEIKDIVAKAIKETGAKERKDIGKVMSTVMPKVKGRAEGKLVNKIVVEQLAKSGKKE